MSIFLKLWIATASQLPSYRAAKLVSNSRQVVATRCSLFSSVVFSLVKLFFLIFSDLSLIFCLSTMCWWIEDYHNRIGNVYECAWTHYRAVNFFGVVFLSRGSFVRGRVVLTGHLSIECRGTCVPLCWRDAWDHSLSVSCQPDGHICQHRQLSNR